MPESSHPPAGLTPSGEAGATTCDPEGEALGGIDTSIDSLAATGAVGARGDVGDDGDVTPCSGGDEPGAPAQPATVMTIVRMATLDFIIG